VSDDTSPFGFGRFIPGFDFMQNLAKGASQAMPGLSGWIAPTMSVEELDKRIAELKTVQFWLEQNTRALIATVQALEVQRMTLSTLQGMNVAMGDLADSLGKGATPAAATPAPLGTPAAQAEAASEPTPPPASTPVVDPVQWWSALTQQFQHIATQAMQNAAPTSAAAPAPEDTPPAASPPKTTAKKTTPRKRAAGQG